MDPTFVFDAELWLHSGGRWVFATVPEDETEEIKDLVPMRGGFGSVRVRVEIGSSQWETSVFPSSELGCFVLPIKKPVRKTEDIDVGDTVELSLTVRIDS